jgi:geranylgeranyl diphosphate synthase type I
MAQVLHRANLAMCLGQSYDLAFESATHVGMDEYLAMIDGKSAALFGAACELGALCAGVAAERAAMFAAFGRAFGRAFQIRDDIQGVWASVEQTGKSRATDVARRKWTFPIVWALAGAPSDARTAIERRYASRTPLPPDDIAAIADALDRLGARQAAEDACADLTREARRISEIHGVDPAGCVLRLFEPREPALALA